MERFQLLDADRPTRRALLITPLAFAGLVAASSRRERPLPVASEDGSGPEINLVDFSDDGSERGLSE